MHEQRSASLRWGPRLLRDLVNAPDLAAAAAHLACAGVPVFPCVPGGKRPLTVHGFQDASIDPGIVTAWWDRRPDANIGVPTGVLGGIDVVDVDVHEGGSGFASFNQALRAGFVEGWACLVRTPRVACTRLPPPNVARSAASSTAPRCPSLWAVALNLPGMRVDAWIPRRSSNRGLEATLTLRTESNALGEESGGRLGSAAWSVNPQDVRSGFRR
ncbi:MAG TPA: bifunctional DNA primase/polymerase [Intrasporangiaceae bacterium]|nr:bifunctional DNA primase/polymerase [Intrasporangiaceae bacterium]